PDDGDQLAELLGVERLRPEPALGGDLGVPPIQGELALGQRHLDPVRRVLGRVAEERVHLGPEALLLETEGAVDVGAAAAVPPARLPPDEATLEDEDVHARALEPPGRAEPGHPAADHDHAGSVAPGHPLVSSLT